MIVEIAISSCVLAIGYRITNRLPRREHVPMALRLAVAVPEPWNFAAAVRDGEVTLGGQCARCLAVGGVDSPPACGGGSVCRGRQNVMLHGSQRTVTLPVPGPGVRRSG